MFLKRLNQGEPTNFVTGNRQVASRKKLNPSTEQKAKSSVKATFPAMLSCFIWHPTEKDTEDVSETCALLPL